MKRIFTLMLLLMLDLSASAQYRGTIISDSLVNSKAYPGTVHHYKIYIPQEYDGTSDANCSAKQIRS